MSYTVQISPVDLRMPVQLPKPWAKLEAQNFHPDLLERAKGFYLQAKRLGMQEQAEVFLLHAGEGFLKPFDPEKFKSRLSPTDPLYQTKQNALVALYKLSQDFEDRVPTFVWETYAFLATRKDADQHTTILTSKDELPFGWWLADTALHGVGKVYGFKHNLDTVFFRETGMLFEHNCDCSCDIHPAGKEGGVNAPLPKERWPIATAALFSHLAGEFLLITGLKMPFEMGLSPEAAEVMAMPV